MNSNLNKPCKRCNLTERYEKDGRCKPCHRKNSLKWQKKKLSRVVSQHKKWRKKNPEKWKMYHFKAKYGITLVDYDAMLARQKGLCKLCNQLKKLVVDHCHETGKVRGLLCIGCNAALGAYQKLSKEPYKSILKTYL